MRKRLLGSIVVALLLLGGVAPAGESPVTVKPNPVRQGKTLTITAKDCKSGPGFEAFVLVTIINSNEVEKFHAKVPAKDSGTTDVKVRISKTKFKRGFYMVFVDCIHEFDDGGSGVWYETDTELKVKRPPR